MAAITQKRSVFASGVDGVDDICAESANCGKSWSSDLWPMIVIIHRRSDMATQTVSSQTDRMIEALTLDKVRGLFPMASAEHASLIPQLSRFYAEDVRFRSALFELEGRDQLLAAARRLLEGEVVHCIVLGDAAQAGNTFFIDWSAELWFSQMLGFSFDGASKLTVNAQGKIIEHHDYWDPWGALADTVPGVGQAYRWILRKLA
jgi:hypothetical protein